MSEPKVMTRDTLADWFYWTVGNINPDEANDYADELMGLCVETRRNQNSTDFDEACDIGEGEIGYSLERTGPRRLVLVISPDASPVSDGPSDDAVLCAKATIRANEILLGHQVREDVLRAMPSARRILAAKEASDE